MSISAVFLPTGFLDKVFWDYSKLPFNLGDESICCSASSGNCSSGLIKLLYPKISAIIEKNASDHRKDRYLDSGGLYGGEHAGFSHGADPLRQPWKWESGKIQLGKKSWMKILMMHG